MLTADIPLSSGACVGLRLVNDDFLESFSLPLSGGEAVVVLERDVTRPVEDVVRQCRGDVSALREVVRQWPLQALLIEKMYLPVPVLRIERNYHAFCPLYALYGKGTLHLEWDPVNLYRYLEGPGLLNRGQCMAFLEGRWNYGPETVFRDIHMLPERGVLEVTEAGGLNIVRPPSLAVPSPRALAEGSDPVERLHDLLKAAVARWPLAAGTTFCELSSGHDTTLVAHMLAGRFFPEALKTVGYHLSSGMNAAAVMARRRETLARLKTVDFTLPDAVSVPGLASPSGKTWPYHTYGNGIHPLAGHIVSAGGNIVFSGIGGDELCGVTEAERIEDTASRTFRHTDESSKGVVSLLPDRLVSGRADVSAWPRGLVPESANDMANWVGPSYLRRGLWYAHPLALAEIQVFAHFLPAEWRRGRYLSKAILSHLGMSEEFVRQYPPEDSTNDLGARFADESLITTLFRDSILVGEGLLDLAKFRAAQEIVRHNPLNSQAGFPLMTACLLESSLKSLAA